MVKSLQAKIERDDNLYNYILSGRIEIVEKIIGSRIVTSIYGLINFTLILHFMDL